MMKLRIWRVVISVLVAISLLLNALLLIGSLRVRGGLQSVLAMANDIVTQSAGQPLVVEVAVDQAIPVRTTIPIDQAFVVPIEFSYPLNTVVNTYIDIPLLGRQDIALPVETMIPISTALDIPVRMNVPISMTYQLQVTIPVEVQIPPTLLDALAELIVQLDAGLRFPLK